MPKTKSVSPTTINQDDSYLKIWEIEQKHTTTRWTLTTFFLSVSFAIFGISLQIEKPIVPLFIPQSLAVAIYWFNYMLFLRFNDFNVYLRDYLAKMESSKQTVIRLQTNSRGFLKSKGRLSATRLLLYFGIAYTIAAFVIWWLYVR